MASIRLDARTEFDRGLSARVVAIDGSWTIPCIVQNISTRGAKLSVKQPMDDSQSNEFFLFFPAIGMTRRKCRRVWRLEETVGVSFVAEGDQPTTGVEGTLAQAQP
jgi:hypothetical protein